MNAAATIRMLQAGAQPTDPADRRTQARIAWVKATVAALAKAQRAMDDRCGQAVDRLSEEEFERLCDEEQAKVRAILDQLHAIRDHDRWPREMHWTV